MQERREKCCKCGLAILEKSLTFQEEKMHPTCFRSGVQLTFNFFTTSVLLGVMSVETSWLERIMLSKATNPSAKLAIILTLLLNVSGLIFKKEIYIYVSVMFPP